MHNEHERFGKSYSGSIPKLLKGLIRFVRTQNRITPRILMFSAPFVQLRVHIYYIHTYYTHIYNIYIYKLYTIICIYIYIYLIRVYT